MISRVIRKLIIGFSVALAIVLLLVWARTRKSDLVISMARGGTYRELRAGDGKLALMLVPGWPDDEPLSWGRPRPPVDMRPPGFPRQRSVITLLDGTSVSVSPNASSWWPPTQSSGTLFVTTMSGKHLRVTTATSGQLSLFTGAVSGSRTRGGGFTLKPFPTTLAGIASINFSSAATAPTLSGTGPAAGTASDALAGMKGATDLSFRTLPKASTAPGPPWRLTLQTLIIGPSYRYERYALPLAAIAAIVLLPAWLALAAALVRTSRRRRRRRRGLCERCAYDLRGTPSSACPECGTSIPSGEILRARLRT